MCTLSLALDSRWTRRINCWVYTEWDRDSVGKDLLAYHQKTLTRLDFFISNMHQKRYLGIDIYCLKVIILCGLFLFYMTAHTIQPVNITTLLPSDSWVSLGFPNVGSPVKTIAGAALNHTAHSAANNQSFTQPHVSLSVEKTTISFP